MAPGSVPSHYATHTQQQQEAALGVKKKQGTHIWLNPPRMYIPIRRMSQKQSCSTPSPDLNFARNLTGSFFSGHWWTRDRRYVKKYLTGCPKKMEKVANFSKNFGFFEKTQNRPFCFAIFSVKNATTEKKGVYHDDRHGKTKKIAVSDFSFSKLCHRDFCETFS